MDNGADRYLHKKFKKQLSIEPRTNKHHNNNHTPLIIQQTNNNITNDNNRVPTTNHDNNSTNSVVLNYVKSSISRGDNDLVFSEQKSSTDISYVSERNHFIKQDDVLNLKRNERTFNNTTDHDARVSNQNQVYSNRNVAVYRSNQNERVFEHHQNRNEAFISNRNDGSCFNSIRNERVFDNKGAVLNQNERVFDNKARNAEARVLNLNHNEQRMFGDVYNQDHRNANDKVANFNRVERPGVYGFDHNRSEAFNLNQNDGKEVLNLNRNQNEPRERDDAGVYNLNQNEIVPDKVEVKVLNNRNLDERVSDKEDNEQSQSSITFGGEEEKQEGKTGGGKYVCTYCNLACSKPSVLQKHIRAHTNERPYPCVSCGFSFKTRSNLYKHCRSRSHANRVMGHKAREMAGEPDGETPEPPATPPEVIKEEVVQPQVKPYKPRFHTAKFFDENTENNQAHSERISTRINELIDKNNSIVNKTDQYLQKRRPSIAEESDEVKDEPLNLTNKSRKRCLSEVSEPAVQKSLIKELLLKNYADTNMQCPHCKMIFQTVTELELHKMRNCKGMTKTGARYSRSSSVNVASILTQNKNAFDNIPQVFPLKSPGPFLGKTRLVESDKSKSFSYEDVIQFPTGNDLVKTTQRYSLSPLSVKKPPVKLFGGEVKIAQTTGDSKNFKIDGKERNQEPEYINKTENRVVKSTLQSGGTVLQNKKPDAVRTSPEVIRVYDNPEKKDNTVTNGAVAANENSYNYTNLMDFSQKAARMLAPNLHHQLNVAIPGLSIPVKYPEASSSSPLLTLSSKYPESPVARMQDLTISNQKLSPLPQTFPSNITNPMNLLYNGKVVRYVPGIPGPVTPLEPAKQPPRLIKPDIMITPVSKACEQEVKPEIHSPLAKSPETPPPRKFARPNSLALKPSMSSLKQHHGLTPTMFNQILISPDTPRGAKKYNEHFLHGNYFSYLGLKSSTKPVYCTLNKTQPFYVPHFKKLSMYSEWRQQDHKSDKLYASAYDSRQRPPRRFTVAGKYNADYFVHSSYKFTVSEVTTSVKEESQKSTSILGGYESTEEYTYVRGRGRGRYVCEECGIRCKKPSMLKKHIRTHMNIRPYRCDHCNFSFKTKGNLTKHLKSKVHNKNYAASNCSSSGSASPAPHTHSSDSEDSSGDDDSSDESSTRQQEHEAAYGLLSLSQKPTSTVSAISDPSVSPMSVNSADGFVATTTSFINAEQLAHVSKTSYAKNKILDQPKSNPFNPSILCSAITTTSTITKENDRCLGLTNSHRPLMYPYTNLNLPAESPAVGERMEVDSPKPAEMEKPVERKNIVHFNVIKRYNPQSAMPPQHYYNNEIPDDDMQNLHRKRKHVNMEVVNYKLQKNDSSEVMDLSMPQVSEKQVVVNGGEVDRVKKFQNKEGAVLMKNYYNHASEEGCTPQTVAFRSGENVQVDKDNNRINVNYIIQESGVADGANTNNWIKTIEYDNSAMETLADIATKQEKLEKNSVAKNVATEFLKLATKNEYPNGDDKAFMNTNKEINDLVVKSEENKSCTICSKNFSKPSQLRLHMNIHYLERPFKCESCAVSFRTKGHLQKHERSAGHHNKLSSSPALSSSEPRPFKCTDCNIAFRIHGHLAKHLRSKMHIMKLECLAKIPFGLYAELERSNSLLTEINTADGDQCLDSLKLLAKKVFINDPSKLNQLDERVADHPETDTDS